MCENAFFASASRVSAPTAPLLALQEVGDAQSKALRATSTSARILQLRRPGLGNALIIPARYEVLAARRGYYVLGHLRGIRVGPVLVRLPTRAGTAPGAIDAATR